MSSNYNSSLKDRALEMLILPFSFVGVGLGKGVVGRVGLMVVALAKRRRKSLSIAMTQND